MTEQEAKNLVNRAMKIILSCRSLDQLHVAVKYADLTYRKISKTIGLVNTVNFVRLIERSIGFAQCQIKAKQG